MIRSGAKYECCTRALICSPLAPPGCFKAHNAKRPMQSMHRAFWNVAAVKKLLFEAAHCGGVETAVYVHDFAADA